jgi:hypothetical protein
MVILKLFTKEKKRMTDLPAYMKPKDLGAEAQAQRHATRSGDIPTFRTQIDDVETDIGKLTSQLRSGDDPIKNIRGWLKLLTHRQMRDLVTALFDVHSQISHYPPEMDSRAAEAGKGTISKHQMADVLDAFAHQG